MTTGTPQPMDPRRPGSSRRPARRRSLLSLLPLLGVAWAVLEIWLLLMLGDAAGGWAVFGALLAGFLLGALVIQRAGRRAWQRLAESLQHPDAAPGAAGTGRERGGNALAMAGGLLLMIPGLLSDALGLLFVFPPTAALLRRAGRRLLITGSGPLGTVYQEVRAADQQRRMHRADGKVVRGEVVDPPEDDVPGDGGADGDTRPGGPAR
jgi:UPF0716 protein FxsA